jgi:hypothetical protein
MTMRLKIGQIGMQFTHSRRQLKYQFGTGALEES